MVSNIASQSANNTIKAPPGLCKAKKTKDHKTFKNNCTQKIKIICCFFHAPSKPLPAHSFVAGRLPKRILFATAHFLSQTKYREMPIKTNITVHTGPKIQFGGLKVGFSNVRYHPLICGTVKKDPTLAASSQIIIQVKSLTALKNSIGFIQLIFNPKTLL